MTPQELKASILQLAIQGKLVEQRPEEGTAAELVEKIAHAETRRRGGKLGEGKDGLKHLPKAALTLRGTLSALSASPREAIPDDEKPFDIPESWEWVRLGDCTNYADKKAKILPEDICPETWSLDLEDIEKETGKITNFRLAKDRRITGDKVVFHKGEILYSKLRPYLKKILVASKEGICTPELVPFSPYGDIDANYLVIVLKSPSVDFAINSVTYGVKMPRVGTDTMLNLLVPLPPLAEQKRIVAKIEELLPLIDRYEKAWSKLEDFNKRFPVDMQKSLLQMAIQGKLVEQRADEGTGEELYRQIQTEKQRLIKSGKIKKEMPLPEITPDEIPFDIPDSWKWVRLGAVLDKLVDGTHRTPKYTTSGVPFVSVRNMSSGVLSLSDTKFISEEEHSELVKRCNPQRGDILLSKVGTTGVPAKVETDEQFSLFVSVALLKFNKALLDIDFLYLTILSPSFQKQCEEHTRGVGNKNWVIVDIANTIFPLPPLAEQKRIVAKLEEILPLCEQLK